MASLVSAGTGADEFDAAPKTTSKEADDPLGAALGRTDPVEAAALRAGATRLRGSAFKRCLDFCGAVGGLIFLAPLLLLIALAIRLESRGPILFRQRRTGLDGGEFAILKFRSMKVVEDGPTIVQASRDDDRTTAVGAFLRRSSLDELPQLINVLKSEMSLVGPRPHAVAHDVYYGAEIPRYALRFMAKPGITGLAQVSGYRGATPDVATMAGRVGLDLEYIRTWSPILDFRILLQTLTAGPVDPAAF